MSQSRTRNYFEVLGVSPNATEEEISAAFRRESQAVAALSGAEREHKLDELLDAYNTLRDPAQRDAYRERVRYQPRSNPGFFSGKSSNPLFDGSPGGPPLAILRWLMGKRKRGGGAPAEKPKTLTQLMDFDWDSAQPPEPDSPEYKKAQRDDVLFKIMVVAVVALAVAGIVYLVQ